MQKLAVAPAPPAPADTEDAVLEEDGLIEEDLLVEDVSIDGMCGVY
jgi:mycofactocin precursor